MEIPPGAGGAPGCVYIASTLPPVPKAAHSKRIAFEVEIPDEALIDADYFFPTAVTSPKKKEVVEEKPYDKPILEVEDSF